MRVFDTIRKHAILLTTLFAIIALGFIYFFIYLPRNEKIIREQRFHALQDIDENVHAKIDNSVVLLKNLLTAYAQAEAKNHQQIDTPNLNEYVRNISRDKFKIIPYQKINQTDSVDDVHTVQINNKTEEIILNYSLRYPKTEKDTTKVTWQIGMRFSFSQFIDFLLTRNVFDDYLIFSGGKTVYETFPAGVSHVKDDSLMGIDKGMSVSSLHDFTISGVNYKVFLQPVHFTSDNEWVIGGLLTEKRYEAEKKQLPFQVILLLITLAFCLIVVIPWIKLFHMGGKDRLIVADGVFSGLVAMLLISVLFLSLFKYNLPFRTDDSPDSKAVLSTKITNAFKTEIDSAFIILNKCNKLLKDEKILAQDIVGVKNLSFRSLHKKNADSTAINNILGGILADNSIDHLFWLNGKGEEMFRWTKETAIPPKGKFATREYFKHSTSSGRLFNIKNNHTDTTDRFFLDQVNSWTSGSFTSVLSIPYEKGSDSVAALAFKINSLSNVILPLGYQFAIIDAKGTVLYHSDSSRNLNENLLDKFDNQKELQGALDSHAESIFLTNYLSRNYNVKVKPVTNLPYYIVILSDTAYKNTRDLEIYSFTFTMLVLLFLFLIIEMLIIFFASAKRSFFKKHLFDMSWVGPKRSGHNDYFVSSLFNIVIITCLCFSPRFSFLTYLFILLFAICSVTLFLNWLYYLRYSDGSLDKQNKKKYKKRTIWILGILILVLDYAGSRMLEPENFGRLIGYELLFIAFGILIMVTTKRYRNLKYPENDTVTANAKLNGLNPAVVSKGNNYQKPGSSRRFSILINKEHYLKSFSFMLLTRLIVTSAIPVIFFYTSSYNYEQNLNTRYRESQFAQRLIERLPSDSNGAAEFVKEMPSVYTDGSWINTVSVTDSFLKPRDYNDEEKRTLAILNGFRPDVTTEAVIEENFYNVVAADTSFSFNHLLEDACVKDEGNVMHIRTANANVNLRLSSTGLNYNLPKLLSRKGSLFWIFLVLILVGFYYLLRNIIKKLFALKIPDMKKWEKFDKDLLANNRLNELIFVIGPSGVNKKRTVTDKIEKGEIIGKDGSKLIFTGNELKDNVYLADLINIPDTDLDKEENRKWKKDKLKALDKEIKLVIVNHFEYNIEDSFTNRHKLNFLESLMLNGKAKIIILSTVHPMNFLDSALFQEKKNKEKKDEDSRASISAADLDRWNVLLGHYRIAILPLTEREDLEEEVTDVIFDKNNKDNKTILSISDGQNGNSISNDQHDKYEYQWSYISGPKEPTITPEKGRVITVSKLVEGMYEFAVKITGEDGYERIRYKMVKVYRNLKDGNVTTNKKESQVGAEVKQGHETVDEKESKAVAEVKDGHITVDGKDRQVAERKDNPAIANGKNSENGQEAENNKDVQKAVDIDVTPLYQMICTETKNAQFLNKMKAVASQAAFEVAGSLKKDGKDFNTDEIAFKLQLSSHYYYMYLWQSLTKEEKFLIYDLAEDNLVNSFDDYNLSMLICKGIIYVDDDGTLRLFNKGFRNFVLTAIGNSEAMKIKERIRDNGNWGKWKTPLILSLIAILGFLMVSQQEVYAKLLTYVGAVGAGIPVFLKLLSLFDKGQKAT